MNHKKLLENIYLSFSKIENQNEFIDFMMDLFTPKEIENIFERLEVAKLLNFTDLSYREISIKTKVSLVTVTRVARFLRTEKNHGYKIIFDKFK